MSGEVTVKSRYARWEHERRWVLHALPAGVESPRQVTDLYLPATTLRLRRVSTPEADTYKLTQKVRPAGAGPSSATITTMYLSEPEHRLLSSAFARARPLVKTRWTYREGGLTFGVDEFDGRLDGLLLAEIEVADSHTVVQGPSGAAAEVTNDERFTGAELARSSAGDLRRALDEVTSR